MREVTKTVFLYSELSEIAKSKARDWYREASASDDFYAESVIDDAAEVADIMGIDLRQTPKRLADGTVRYDPSISYSGFWSQGSGASFSGVYVYKKGASRALKAYAPKDQELHRICKALQDAQKKVFYSASCRISDKGYYSHSGTMQFEFDMNENVGEATFNDVEEDISQALKDFADWIYRQLEKEYEFHNSDEIVAVTVGFNGYEFNEDGTRA